MITPAQQAAHLLVERRISGSQGERLPDNLRPATIEAALAIQSSVSLQWCEQMDDSIGAWKCSLPSADKIIVAPIYTRTIDSIPPVSLWPKLDTTLNTLRARIEPELAFYLGVDLPARSEPYSTKEIDCAIVRTHLALELINSRYSNSSECHFLEMLADGLVNQGLFIGPEIDGELGRTASELTLTVDCANGEKSEHQGRHPNSEPRAPLYWLVEFLRSQGQDLLAGQVVITGSFAGVIEVPLNTQITINYAGLGQMQASFNAKRSL